jgi:outer membrane receptor for ferrienterochelin and colicin
MKTTWKQITRLLVFYVLVNAFFVTPLLAQNSDGASSSAMEKEQLSLGDILDLHVVTASKSAQRLSEAPAIVSVVTQAEIKLWGYRSVAEALANIPGFYMIDDFVSPNFGVRGINGGQRAYNRIVKVMVNGNPVSLRSDGSHFLGTEFMAMESIDHIEIVRGPASALYGANAYLGVINIITKEGRKSKNKSLAVFVGGPKPEINTKGELMYNPADEHDKWMTNISLAYS